MNMPGSRLLILTVVLAAIMASVFGILHFLSIRARHRLDSKLLYAINGIAEVPSKKVFDRVSPLIRDGANPWLKGDWGQTTLMYAAFEGSPDAVRLLLGYGMPVNERDSGGCTALYWAAGTGEPEIIQMLSVRGASVDAATHDGRTPLMHSARWGHARAAKALLDLGANPDLRDDKGGTALIHAVGGNGAASEIEALVEILLKRGADPRIATRDGRTPLSIARASHLPRVSRLLINASRQDRRASST